MYMMSMKSRLKNQSLNSSIVLWLAVPSITLFLLTVNSSSIIELQADGLHYWKSLPIYYWISVSITLVSILIPFLARLQLRKYAMLLPLILLGLYLYGTPILTSEIPRFQDVFIHGAEAVPIISTGFIDPTYDYAREYPNAFIHMAMSIITQNVETFVYFRFIELFILLSVVVFVFLLARLFSPTYAPIASLAFMGIFMADQGHFSPQGIAIIIYLVFFLSLIKTISASKYNRSWFILAVIALIAINLTSPTNSFFLLVNLLMIAATGYVLSKQRHRKIANRVLFFGFLCGIIFLGWSVYSAQSHTILKAETFGGEIAEKFGSVEGVKVTKEPDISYSFVNNIRMSVTIFVITSGVALSIILLRNKVSLALILTGWFAISYFMVVSMYASSSLLGRNFMYAVFPWSFLVVSFLANRKDSRLHNIVKVSLVLSIVLFIVLVPITRYGREPTTYLPASLIDSTEMIAERSQDGKVVSYSMGGTALKYFNAVQDNDINIRRYLFFFEKSFEEERVYHVENWIQREAAVTDDKIIFSEAERNIIVLKYSEGEVYDTFEKDIRGMHNLIISNGDSRVYSKIE